MRRLAIGRRSRLPPIEKSCLADGGFSRCKSREKRPLGGKYAAMWRTTSIGRLFSGCYQKLLRWDIAFPTRHCADLVNNPHHFPVKSLLARLLRLLQSQSDYVRF